MPGTSCGNRDHSPSQGCCRWGGAGRAAALEAGTPWNLGGGPTCDAFSQAVIAHWRLELSLQRPRGPPQGCNLGGDEGEDTETWWARVTGGMLPWRSRGGQAGPSLVCVEAVVGRLGGQAAPRPRPPGGPAPSHHLSLHHLSTTPRTARPPLRLHSSVHSFRPPTLTSPPPTLPSLPYGGRVLHCPKLSSQQPNGEDAILPPFDRGDRDPERSSDLLENARGQTVAVWPDEQSA